jgi:hypothetical protein
VQRKKQGNRKLVFFQLEKNATRYFFSGRKMVIARIVPVHVCRMVKVDPYPSKSAYELDICEGVPWIIWKLRVCRMDNSDTWFVNGVPQSMPRRLIAAALTAIDQSQSYHAASQALEWTIRDTTLDDFKEVLELFYDEEPPDLEDAFYQAVLDEYQIRQYNVKQRYLYCLSKGWNISLWLAKRLQFTREDILSVYRQTGNAAALTTAYEGYMTRIDKPDKAPLEQFRTWIVEYERLVLFYALSSYSAARKDRDVLRSIVHMATG